MLRYAVARRWQPYLPMLTVETAAPYIFRYENRSEAIGAFGHRRCYPAAELMSAASSPGGTWPIFIAERQLLALAAAFAACFSHSGDRFTRL
jgi:hypothetical protein